MSSLNYNLFKKLYEVLDVNNLKNSLSSFLEVYKLSPKELADVLKGLYLTAYLKVRQQFEEYLRTHPTIAVNFDKVLKSNPSLLDLQEAVDLISVSAFGNTFFGKIEEEIMDLLKNLTQEGKTWLGVMKYVIALAEKDLEKAQQISDYLYEKRYAKVLALIE